MNDRLPGTTYDNPIWHGKWRIYLNPDAPETSHDAYLYVHDDVDSEDDPRYGAVASIVGAKAEIDAYSAFHPARDAFDVSLIWATQGGDALIAYMARVSNSKAQPDDPADKLIGYLLKHHHWSPFEMASMCLEIRTQRDISAQILRHRSFSFQEFSTRYAEVEELLAVTECRFQDTSNRQNSLTVMEVEENTIEEIDAIDATVPYFDAVVNETRVRSLEAYQELLARGVAKEVARRILPIGLMPTKMYMSGTVRSWLHYTAERTKPGVQKEHRVIALAAVHQLADAFPAVYRAAAQSGLFEGSDFTTMPPVECRP